MVDDREDNVLKPCPICGATGLLDCRGKVDGGWYQVNVTCAKESCNHKLFGHGEIESDAIMRAKQAWNKYSPVCR